MLEYIKIKEAAEILKVSPATLRNWNKAGKLVPHRHPMNHYRLYTKTAVIKLKSRLYPARSLGDR